MLQSMFSRSGRRFAPASGQSCSDGENTPGRSVGRSVAEWKADAQVRVMRVASTKWSGREQCHTVAPAGPSLLALVTAWISVIPRSCDVPGTETSQGKRKGRETSTDVVSDFEV